MSHLLAIAVGPVQDFIAAARRTRDLWFGSDLLSEISRAVAKAVEDQRGRLIFPADLKAENVANVILAELGTGDPKVIVAVCQASSTGSLAKVAEEARSEAASVIRGRHLGRSSPRCDRVLRGLGVTFQQQLSG